MSSDRLKLVTLCSYLTEISHQWRQADWDTHWMVKALKGEDDRYHSPEFAERCRQYFWNFMYCRSSLYDEQLARYLSRFNRSQFHFMTLADLAADPAAATRRILAFLGLDENAADGFDFSVHNADGSHAPYCDESRDIMRRAFDGLTTRTERLIGQPLDWSV